MPPKPIQEQPIREHRYEFDIICGLVEENSRVLDLGCGEGNLLKMLHEKRHADCAGVEVSEDKVYACVSKGLSVHHGDIDVGLADFPDNSFDYVILSETLQEVRKPALVFQEMLRVGRKCIVSFPNFGIWSARWQLLMGRSPVTDTLPFEWYEGPNIQFLTINDFIRFCEHKHYAIDQAHYFRRGKSISLFPNLLADSALFVLEKESIQNS
ncbi:MAG: methionine biosynthesis protein MetW [Candidatus Omnitrophica bacterium]|nr:methionine biosynthesis protein MetW [Candidatus Omnitrophota bacterium]